MALDGATRAAVAEEITHLVIEFRNAPPGTKATIHGKRGKVSHAAAQAH